MLPHPVDERGPIDAAGGEIEHEALLLIDSGIDLRAVENEKRFHGGVPYPLVAIDERVARNERKAERRRLLN
jgi:hypothetical protein